jgi:hypothetical protein
MTSKNFLHLVTGVAMALISIVGVVLCYAIDINLGILGFMFCGGIACCSIDAAISDEARIRERKRMRKYRR